MPAEKVGFRNYTCLSPGPSLPRRTLATGTIIGIGMTPTGQVQKIRWNREEDTLVYW